MHQSAIFCPLKKTGDTSRGPAENYFRRHWWGLGAGRSPGCLESVQDVAKQSSGRVASCRTAASYRFRWITRHFAPSCAWGDQTPIDTFAPRSHHVSVRQYHHIERPGLALQLRCHRRETSHLVLPVRSACRLSASPSAPGFGLFRFTFTEKRIIRRTKISRRSARASYLLVVTSWSGCGSTSSQAFRHAFSAIVPNSTDRTGSAKELSALTT